MNSLSRLISILERHARVDGIHPCSIKGVGFIRTSTPTMLMPVVYEPTLCLVAQGRKRVVLGSTTYVYDAANFLVASVDLPVMGSVIEASVDQPYLCLVLELNLAELGELVIRHPSPDPEGSTTPVGITLNRITPELLDAAVRLAGLLDCPRDIDELAPLAMREIFYRLLTGPGNRAIRQMAQADSRLNQIARTIVWIRAHYNEGWSIDQAADVAGMSRSSFHAHFRAVTSMTPLEFRTQLRMQEARRIMVAEAIDAATAGFRVGYESPSQFSRDYGRAFGMPPIKDTRRLRLDTATASA